MIGRSRSTGCRYLGVHPGERGATGSASPLAGPDLDMLVEVDIDVLHGYAIDLGQPHERRLDLLYQPLADPSEEVHIQGRRIVAMSRYWACGPSSRAKILGKTTYRVARRCQRRRRSPRRGLRVFAPAIGLNPPRCPLRHHLLPLPRNVCRRRRNFPSNPDPSDGVGCLA